MRTRAAATTTARRPSGSRRSTNGRPAPSRRGVSTICFTTAERAPYAAQNHPTAEHFLPLFVTLGAAYDDEPGVRIHSSYDRGLLSLDAYAFGLAAPLPREIRVRAAPPGRRGSTLGAPHAAEADHPGARRRLARAVRRLVRLAASRRSRTAARTSGLARVAAFLTWQVIAFVVAALGAFATRYARAARRRGRQAGRLRAARAQRVPRRVVHRADGLPLLRRAAVRVAAHGSSSAMTPQPVTAGSV